MALVVYDRVQETTSTTGTGAITLGGAVSGYQSFAVVGNGNTTFYCIVNGAAWEVGIGTYSTTGPTLTRTTILSNSNGTTSPITLSGPSNVFVTYPSEKSVNLDGSGNVSALGTISSGTWQGSTVGVAYGGTGVTSSSGANSVVLRDANSNVTFNNYIAGFSATTAAGTTTVLTVSSSRNQVLVGSTTQTFQLPNATTLQLGQSFVFINNSSGVLTVTNNAGTTIETVPSGGITQLGATSIGTSAGSWGAYSFIPAAVDWGTNALNLASTVISGGTWNGGTIQSGYGGTGLTTFTAANYALYSTSSSALTAGTLPVPAGGTGQTSFSSGYIPYGNSSAALQSSSLLQFNGSYLQVGGGSVLGGATNPIAAFTQSANNYVQTYIYNNNTGISTSSDFVAYTNNSTDAHGWADLGFTGSNYADPVYTCTGPNEAYVFGSALNSSYTGNLVYATDSTGSANAHQWYVGGFTQAKSAWKMQLTSTGLQLANALGAAYGGTGTAGTITGIPYANGTSAYTAASAANVVTLLGATAVANATYATTAGSAPNPNALTITSPLTGTSYNGSSAVSIGIPVATSLASGYLSSTDWTTFNNKLSTAVTSAVAGTGVSVSASTGAVTFSIGQAVGTSNNVQFNSIGVNTAGSGTAGEIRATNNITAYYSDKRLKTKVGNIENALDKVMQIETMVYHANETAVGLGYDASIIEVGVTAQSVQKVMPQTVAPAPIDDKYLTVRYERLVPLLIEAIKELEAQVAELKAR